MSRQNNSRVDQYFGRYTVNDRRKLSRLFLMGLLVLGLALTGCVGEEEDDAEEEEDSSVPVVLYLA